MTLVACMVRCWQDMVLLRHLGMIVFQFFPDGNCFLLSVTVQTENCIPCLQRSHRISP